MIRFEDNNYSEVSEPVYYNSYALNNHREDINDNDDSLLDDGVYDVSNKWINMVRVLKKYL